MRIFISLFISQFFLATLSYGATLYVVHAAENQVSVINTDTNTVTATITSPTFTFGGGMVATNSNTPYVFVTTVESDKVSVIDASANTVLTTIPVGIGAGFGIAITPDGQSVYVSNRVDFTVSVINTSTLSVKATINLQDAPSGIAITSDGKSALVTGQGDTSGSVSVIDTTTNTVTRVIPNVGSNLSGIAITPDDQFAYVAGLYPYIIDLTTFSIVPSSMDLLLPFYVSVTPDGKFVYMTTTRDGSINFIDTTTQSISNVLNLDYGDDSACGIAMNPDNTVAYVTNIMPSLVCVIDNTTQQVKTTIPVGTPGVSRPTGIAIR